METTVTKNVTEPKVNKSRDRKKNPAKDIQKWFYLNVSTAKPQVNCPGRAKYHYRGMAWLPFQKCYRAKSKQIQRKIFKSGFI